MNRKTAIITGGSRGIGAETARLLAVSGYNVVIGYRTSRDAAEAVAGGIRASGGEAATFRHDAASSAGAEALLRFSAERYQKTDLLVNNAGIALRRLLTDTSDSDWQRVLDVNLSGVFFLSRAAAAHMLRRKQGAIVNLSSVCGLAGAAMETAYSAAKAGVVGLTKAMAKELAPSGITVNCVAPGVIDTEMNRFLSEEERASLSEEIPLGRFGTVREVAETVLFLAENRYLTGQVISPDGGWQP